MDIIQSIILGIIQGLAEFLPISSSAHLIIIPWLLGWKEHTQVFDVALHMGTLLAIIIFFFKDYISLLSNGFTKPGSEQGKLFWFIIIATIPAAIFGYFLDKTVEEFFRTQILLIAIVIFVFGIIIFLVDKFRKKDRDLTKLTIIDVILIGLSQAIALFPGVSRSGVTITTGLALGFKRDEAAKFSFLLSGPVIFGAGTFSLLKNLDNVKNELTFFIIGFLAAAITGFIAIKFMMNYLKTKSFLPFVIYRVVLALVIVFVFIVRSSN